MLFEMVINCYDLIWVVGRQEIYWGSKFQNDIDL